MDFKELVEYMVKCLVDNPDDVEIHEVEGEKSTILELKVRKEDIGKVIGKHGRIARAIRTILNASATKLGKKVAIIDREDMIGGVSLHSGTIPSKTLREAILYLSGLEQRAFYGNVPPFFWRCIRFLSLLFLQASRPFSPCRSLLVSLQAWTSLWLAQMLCPCLIPL